jgi:hypothetical protein
MHIALRPRIIKPNKPNSALEPPMSSCYRNEGHAIARSCPGELLTNTERVDPIHNAFAPVPGGIVR